MKKQDEPKEEITFDQNTQRALAYLSGIPTAEEESMIEAVGNVSERQTDQFYRLMGNWLHLQRQEIREIGTTLLEVLQRVDLSKELLRSRLESPEFHALVRKSFRNWSTAESEQKRIFVRNLLVNSVMKNLSPDFAISLFIDWLDKYSDEHYKIIKAINEADPVGLTRLEIWQKLHDYIPGEDSAEADLYKLLVLDLNTGHIIRQPREKDFRGQFIKATPTRKQDTATTGVQSAFENTKKYVLTELGKQFVTYILEEP